MSSHSQSVHLPHWRDITLKLKLKLETVNSLPSNIFKFC